MLKIGEKIDQLTVLEYTDDKKVICQCDCGNIISRGKYDLRIRNNRNTIFKCKQCHLADYIEQADKTGWKLGKLTVLDYISDGNYHCKCDCGNELIVHTSNLRQNDLRRSRTSCGCDVTHYNKNEDFFEVIDTEEKTYILGFIAADGCVHNNVLKITLNSQDYLLLKNIAKVMQYDGPVKIKPVETILPQGTICKSEVAELVICSAKIIQDLYALGITERKSKTLAVDYKKIPEHLLPHFLRGLFEGDGCLNITSSNKRISYAIHLMGSKNIINFVQSYFSNCNAYLSEPEPDVFSIMYGSRDAFKKISNILYANATFYLQRKYDLYLKNQKILNYIEQFTDCTDKQKHIEYMKLDFTTGDLKTN